MDSFKSVGATRRSIFIYFCFLVVVMCPYGCVGGLTGTVLQDLLCLLKISLKTASSIFVFYGLGMCIANAVVMIAKHRLDTSITLPIAIIMCGIFNLLVPNSTYLPLTCCLYFLLGLSNGTVAVCATVQMGVILPKKDFGFHLQSAALSFGYIISPLIGSLFVSDTTKTNNMSVINSSCVIPLQNVTCPSPNIGFSFVFVSSLLLISGIGIHLSFTSLSNQGMDLEPERSNDFDNYPNISECLHRCFNLLILSLFCFSCVIQMCLAYLLVTFGLTSNLHMRVETMSEMVAVYNFGLLASRIFNAYVSEKLDASLQMFVYLIILIANSVIFLVYQDSSATMLWIICTVYGIGAGPLFASLLAWARCHTALTPSFIGACYLLAWVGNLVHPTVTGILMDLYGPNVLEYILSITCVIMLILFVLLYLITRKIGKN